ncbi:Protein CBG22636 [Caenorhabditis briggsae]|uniref:Protein CBG22636 n=1 Tax=Caenorhabditis briggsae TaxID=6238 RepID=A8Y2R3_CAEBR|nr:Protein CBG22636 [Caenorhabditis briggsae]CAP39188.2 Protein CBG22636 [Caenorhabditis briggsae]
MAKTGRTESTQTSIYSITNHLFIAVCLYYLFILLIVISYLSNFVLFLIATLAIFLAAISHAYQIVLSFLAIQRFFIYFFPCLEQHLTPKKPRKLWTNSLLLLLFVWACILLGSSYFSIGPYAINWKHEKISMIYYTVLNGLLFFSASFYIPVVISIRRLQHLGSSIKNAPHKYILYQTVIIISFKTRFAQMCLFDLLFTPTTIQISYFLCNKKTLVMMDTTTIELQTKEFIFTIKSLFGFFLVLVSLIFIVISVLIFPLFVMVQRSNREWDKETSVYPITNHFFKAICWFYLFLFIIGIDMIFETNFFLNFMEVENLPPSNYVFQNIHFRNDFAFYPYCFFFLLVITHTHHLILSLLAFQRLFLYFFPSAEPYITSKSQKPKFKYLYLIVFIISALVFYFAWDSSYYQGSNLEYILLVGFQSFLSKKNHFQYSQMQHLASSVKNKPHIYILYQFITILSFNLGHIFPILIYYPEIQDIVMDFFFLDLVSTPLTIQISYLLCNRRTLDTLRKKLTLSNIYQTIFKKSTVEPSVPEVDATTVAPPT